MSQPERPIEELSFEEARAELERVVHALEAGDTTLEQALVLWERGEALLRACTARLDAAETRIERLGPDGQAQDGGIGPT